MADEKHQNEELFSTKQVRELVAGWQNEEDKVRLMMDIYDFLWKASRQKIGSARSATFGSTDLAHDAFLKLITSDAARDGSFESKAHFLNTLRCIINQTLLDRLRLKKRRVQGQENVPVDQIDESEPDLEREESLIELIDLERAMFSLQEKDPELSAIAFMKINHLTYDEIGEKMDLTYDEVRGRWQKAKAFLHKALPSRSN